MDRYVVTTRLKPGAAPAAEDGATRKLTRSCSDSMHDPNCPRLRQCSGMSPERVTAWTELGG